MLSPGDASGFVSSADVLASDGFFKTDVVFLSACSSSVADHSETMVQSFGGVDFAFIGAGARSAVASQWDVSDVASVIYSAEFHAILIEAGSTRGAYDAAQRALMTDLASLSDRAREELDRCWSGWYDSWMRVPSRTHAVHWGAFRLSGSI
jgi:CHAT domain-containing protein